MQLERMGAFHQTRLSFSRVLLRRMAHEGWEIATQLWDLGPEGYGTAVIEARGPERSYSLICYSHELAAEDRSDRSIATAWDATFTLFDGIPAPGDIARLRLSVPKQEAGRISGTELTLARANKSVRVFDYVVDQLASGLQPDADRLHAVGYLMRTTAVYGSGKFGAASWEEIANRPEMTPTFQAEMLTVYLVRLFTIELAEHIAAARGGDTAVKLDPALRRSLGVGNSTGLGMAPFLFAHQPVLHSWMSARETALARVRAIEQADEAAQTLFKDLVELTLVQMQSWSSQDDVQSRKHTRLIRDIEAVLKITSSEILPGPRPWDHLIEWSEEALSLEGQELLLSLVIEPYGTRVDGLAPLMCANEADSFGIDGTQSLRNVLCDIESEYSWALDFDLSAPHELERAWYTSENKGEPRLADMRSDIPDPDQMEMPLAIVRDVQAMSQAIQCEQPDTRFAEFLLRYPNYRHVARRIQRASRYPYGEVRSNVLASHIRPLDLLRCKLSFFGATRFDPKSDRWLQISLFSGAPFPEELKNSYDDFWIYRP